MFPDVSVSSPANLVLVGYAAVFALLVMGAYLLVLIAALLADRARPGEVGRAVFYIFLQLLGVTVMTLSGLTALIGVFAGVDFPRFTYLILLLVFAFGGTLFLRCEQQMQTVDAASKAIPSLLYRYTIKLVGLASGFLGGYSLLSYIFFRPLVMAPRWWVNPFVILLYGLFLAWSVRRPRAEGEDVVPFMLPSLGPALKKRKK